MGKFDGSAADRLVITISVMLNVANYVESECNKGNCNMLQIGFGIGYGAKAIVDHLRDGVKDILTLQQAYDKKLELLGMRNEKCKEFEDCLKGIFGECDPEQIEYILNEDDLKAIEEIYENAVKRYEEKDETNDSD